MAGAVSMRNFSTRAQACFQLLYGMLICALTPVLSAGEAERYWPAGEVLSPAYWWALDTTTDELTSISASAWHEPLRQWLSQPATSLRPLPADGIRLGLLAVTPDRDGHLAARILHPPVALDAVRTWPVTERMRQLALSGGAWLSGSGDWGRPWVAGDGQALVVELPWLPGSPADEPLVAMLELPMAQQPANWPVLRVENFLAPPDAVVCAEAASCGGVAATPRWQGLLRPQALSSRRAQLDLAPLLTEWRGQAGGSLSPGRWWRLTPEVADVNESGRWLPWSVQEPASWSLGWREPVRTTSGRERLLAILDGLLPDVRGWVPGESDRLWRAIQALSVGRPPEVEAEGTDSDTAASISAQCGQAAFLRLGAGAQPDAPADMGSRLAVPALQSWRMTADAPLWPVAGAWREVEPAALGAALDRWRDQALAPPPSLSGMWPRLLAGRLLGLDMDIQQALPGRLAWPGDHHFQACAVAADCHAPESLPSGSLRAAWQAASGTLRWLGDAGLADGEVLGSWRQQLAGVALQDGLLALLGLPADDGQRQRLQRTLQDELDRPPLLRGRSLYLDAGAGVPGGGGYLLWPTADGAVLLLDAADDRPLWVWRPAATLRQWLGHRLDPLSAQPAAGLDSWQIWPAPGTATPASRRFVYGLADGVLLALDVSQPLQPRRLFRSPLPSGVRAGSLGVVSVNLADGPHPLLMLARGEEPDAGDASMLWLLDGITGELLWRAGNREEAGSSLVDARLQAPWQAPWRALPDTDGSVLAYGVDTAGLVWRVTLRGRQVTAAGLLASLADPDREPGSERFMLAPSLSWLRDTAGAVVRPALALASEPAAGVSPAALFAFLDPGLPAGAVLQRADLVSWPVSATKSPEHAVGWVRPWRDSGERAASSPLWLAGQVVVASERPGDSGGCAPAVWQTRIQRLPWRTDMAGVAQEAESREVSAGMAPLAGPVLTGDGELRWPGRPDAVLRLALPAAERVRTGMRPWSGRP